MSHTTTPSIRTAAVSAVALLLGCLFALVQPGALLHAENWGTREATPAVVHPAVLSAQQQVLSLRGEWDFLVDEDRALADAAEAGSLTEESWAEARAIQVPGCWEAQGVGTPGMSQPWDMYWDWNPRPMSHVYMGSVLYRKKIAIPAAWKNKVVQLKIGGVRTEARFWVNGHPVGEINTYCGTYKFDITDYVTPGEEAEIVASVRNDTPSRKGQMCDFHRFGGFYRDIELEATPKNWIDDVWVQGRIEEAGQAASRVARVHITLKSANENAASGQDQPGQISVVLKTLDGQGLAQKSVPGKLGEEILVEIPVPNALLWTPETPNLYRADVELVNRDGTRHGWVERFGFRKLEVDGKRFLFNNLPFFVRGYGEVFIYPLTLISPPDIQTHIDNMKVIKQSGFAACRMHTHCEIPEYFEAADEMGILIQPELPYYTDKPCEAFEFDPMRDLQELYRHYRRYTSFAFYSMGNEGCLAHPNPGFESTINTPEHPGLDIQLRQWVHENDPDRPVQHQDGGENTSENADFCSKPYMIWPRGQFDDLPFPFTAHEYLNLTVKLDPRLEPLFTGALLSPVSMADYEQELDELKLTRQWGDRCIVAAHKLQGYQEKVGLEAARLDPACDGYNFWDFLDQMVVQDGAYTSQGYMNGFYQVKDGGLTPEEFAEFNSPSAVLCEFHNDQRCYNGGDTLCADLTIASFGTEPLASGTVDWTLETENQRRLSGAIPFDDYAVGDTRAAGTIEAVLPRVDRAGKWTLRATVRGTAITNHWDFYLFPEREAFSLKGVAVDPELAEKIADYYTDLTPFDSEEVQSSDAVIALYGSACYEKAVSEGRRVLAIRPTEGDPNVSLGWWWMGSQLGTAFADHEAFGDFPHEGWMSPGLWSEIVKSDPLDISEAIGEFDPLALGSRIHGYNLYMGEKRQGNAQIVAVFGLDLFGDTPEQHALLDNLISYIR